ncbi:MAG: Zn-ribbon domain-containing OB-fold protein, partial [Dehalococcoidia bacterium]|nr:Zn-ribbon domain-containing OB-fold protein [Dehalococcoidia bacterium]
NSLLINEKWFTQTPQGLALVGSRCRSCGRTYFPRKRVCPQCFQIDQMEDVALSRRGRLYTFTVAEAGPPGFNVPYAFGYVDLPEGVRVFSPLEGDHDALAIGMELEMIMGQIREENGVAVISYKFKPI